MIRTRLIHPFAVAALGCAAAWFAGPASAQDEKKDDKPAAETKAEDAKPAEEKKADEAKPEAKKEEAKKEEAKKDEPKKEEPKKEEPKKEEPKTGTEPAAAPGVEAVPLVTNLENPSGVAVHGKTGHVFVASRYGIYRYDPAGHGVTLEISGYPKDVYGKGPTYDIGPLGVGFVGDDWLVVADGSRPDGEELVRLYKVGEKPAPQPMPEDKAEKTFGPIKEGHKTALGDEKTTKPEGNFYGVAVGKNGIWITSNGDDTKGWVHKIALSDGKPADEMIPTLATKVDSDTDAPVPATFNKDMTELYIGQMGEISAPNDGLLLVYGEDGKLKKKYELGLHDPAGLAFSPKTGKLYVTDFAWVAPADGGLFEVTLEGDKATTKKIVSLDKPAGIAFDKEGKLYVTVLGTADEKAKTKDGEPLSPGKLLVIEPGL